MDLKTISDIELVSIKFELEQQLLVLQNNSKLVLDELTTRVNVFRQSKEPKKSD